MFKFFYYLTVGWVYTLGVFTFWRRSDTAETFWYLLGHPPRPEVPYSYKHCRHQWVDIGEAIPTIADIKIYLCLSTDLIWVFSGGNDYHWCHTYEEALEIIQSITGVDYL